MATTRVGVGAAVAVVCAALFALLAVAVAGRHGAPFPVDRSLHVWCVRHRPAWAADAARLVTATGTGPLPYLGAVAAGLIAGRDARERRGAVVAALLFLCLVQATRYAVLLPIHRPRPATADWATLATGYAFPSGHATTSALVAGLLAGALYRVARPAVARTGAVLLGCWAAAVGLSRIYLGVHWPSDVLGGWLYALAWLAVGHALLAWTAGRKAPYPLQALSGGPRPRFERRSAGRYGGLA
ncbi:phosphatase PAP2 family protein [Streptomyces sp. NPDC058279]|uniref:phosphatase PAP2 family protein n=1 Tax=Streptomyces sp. NPDC058279 TaxID=3346418 RepID=UPI0036EE144C